MSQNKRIDHALHNEQVCNYLLEKEGFGDWVVTTAFYSALHFVQGKIFPLKAKTDRGDKFEINSLQEYINIYNPEANKHNVICTLVLEHCNEISPLYNSLKDMSWSARYSSYVVGQKVANKALKRLSEIKKHCHCEPVL